MGNFYFRQKNTGQAEQAYQKAVEIDPRNIKPLMVIGGFYNAIGSQDKALEMYQKALEIRRGLSDLDEVKAMSDFLEYLDRQSKLRR